MEVNTLMQISSADDVKKRKHKESFCPEEFAHKFSSKQDLHTYMKEHRKCNLTTLIELI